MPSSPFHDIIIKHKDIIRCADGRIRRERRLATTKRHTESIRVCKFVVCVYVSHGHKMKQYNGMCLLHHHRMPCAGLGTCYRVFVAPMCRRIC